jgi:hypothetical protein
MASAAKPSICERASPNRQAPLRADVDGFAEGNASRFPGLAMTETAVS